MSKFSIQQLDHVVLRVADMERAIRFYCDALGCKVERKVESISLVQLRAGASLIDLVPRAQDDTESGDLDHFALRIDPFEPETLTAHFAKYGISLGEVARRYGAEGYGPSLYLNDPDGNQVELKGPPEG